MRVTQGFEAFRQDLAFAIRQLRRTPAFTVVAALTLALGIGVNGAIFALVDAALLRPLPFADAGRLVMLWESSERSPRGAVSPPNMLDWHDRARTFEAIGGFAPGVGGMVMNGRDGTAETVSRQWVSARFFDVLGVKPVAGRTFLQSDDDARANVVVLSEAFWETRFDRDPTIVGRDLRLDGMPFTVVGIVPKDFQFLGRTSMWALRSLDRRPQLRGARMLQVIGRMKPGVSIDAARSELAALAGALAAEFPDTNKGRGITVAPLHDALIGGELRTTAALFLGVVGFVLLICCANVANLLLARATVRMRELAVRSALGAGRGRVVRQLLTESLVLSVIGGALGMAIGAAILRAAPAIVPEGLLPGVLTIAFDLRVVAFCAVAAVLVGALFGVAPAWQATKLSSSSVLMADTRTTAGGGSRMRTLLVGGEVATAVLLLFGAGLLLRTLIAVESIDRGYRAREVLTLLVDPLGSRYPTRASLLQFFDDVERELSAVPGIATVAWTSGLPLTDADGRVLFEIAGEAPVDDSRRPVANYQIVSPAYFAAIDLPIAAGRAFSPADNSNSPAVCIVSEAFARGYLQHRSPIGAQVVMRPAGAPQAKPVVAEIVGVARNVKARPDERDDAVQVYLPMLQNPLDDIYLTVRAASGSAAALAPGVRAAIGRVDREQLVSVRDVMTLDEIAWQATSRHRFRAVLVIAFAGLAVVLAMVGVFGILAYAVQQRARDLGVRRALGATSGDVVRLVLADGARVVAGGVAAGLLLAALSSRLLQSMLFGVHPLDAATFAVVTLIVAVTAMAAMTAPLWRATRIDPAAALREGR